jgi:hypothetical protein
MRRALVALLLLLAIAVAPPLATSYEAEGQTSGIAYVDYATKPTFKVGDWVKYRVVSFNAEGAQVDARTLTLAIATQEVWWGEDCFYLEAWTEGPRGPEGACATAMSYAIFDDSLADQRVDFYARKTVFGSNAETGKLEEMLMRPKAGILGTRSVLAAPMNRDVDTLGRDTVQTLKGVFQSTKFRATTLQGNNGGAGDTSVYREVKQVRTVWRSLDVPITHMVREDLETTTTQRAWMVGRSRDAAPAQVVAAGRTVTTLVAFGTGHKSLMLPADRIHTFEQLRAQANAPRKPATPVKSVKPAPAGRTERIPNP